MVANQNYDSEDDFARMQQEAIRRVRDMQNRARATLENAGMHIENSGSDFLPEQEHIGRAQPDSPSLVSPTGHSSDDPQTDDPHTNTVYSNNDPHSNTVRTDDPENNNHRSNDPRSYNSQNNDPRSNDPRTDDTQNNAPRSNDSHNNDPRTDEPRTKEPHQSQRPVETHEPQLNEPPLMQALGLNIALDSDQLLLLLAIYLLIKDGADKWLILALAYVMFT